MQLVGILACEACSMAANALNCVEVGTSLPMSWAVAAVLDVSK